MSATTTHRLDHCPDCGHRITDHGGEGVESFTGQRYCHAHNRRAVLVTGPDENGNYAVESDLCNERAEQIGDDELDVNGAIAVAHCMAAVARGAGIRTDIVGCPCFGEHT